MAEKTPNVARLSSHSRIIVLVSQYTSFSIPCCCQYTQMVIELDSHLGLIMLIRGATSKVLSGTGRVVNSYWGLFFWQ